MPPLTKANHKKASPSRKIIAGSKKTESEYQSKKVASEYQSKKLASASPSRKTIAGSNKVASATPSVGRKKTKAKAVVSSPFRKKMVLSRHMSGGSAMCGSPPFDANPSWIGQPPSMNTPYDNLGTQSPTEFVSPDHSWWSTGWYSPTLHPNVM